MRVIEGRKRKLETSLPPPRQSFAKGWRKLKANNGARVSGPSEQSGAIELGSVFVREGSVEGVAKRGSGEEECSDPWFPQGRGTAIREG